MTIGLLHPGAMGAAVGAQLVAAGQRCVWVPEGRGPATRQRAEEAGLVAVAGLDELAACEVIMSVCPPAAALDVARQVARTGFSGCYVDANAISPRHSREIAGVLTAATVVDGGIVGGPPRRPGTTRLYLSGPDEAVSRVRALFADTFLTPVVVSGPVGAASALKLAFATYNKVGLVLAAQAHVLARAHGVDAQLTELASVMTPGTALAAPERLTGAAQRAWRWSPEMREIAEANRDAGLPADLLDAAAAFLEHWHRHKDDPNVTVDGLLTALSE
ncbi:NAD(P)-dependent oxidoreductase [Actinophytocola oryzae]|uniref:NAD(P)-dependent oxidoreductase n=1 Tax=Actinophytocola oryzae TaxID=502181 RepID=UPI001AAF7B05|nr:NAD(P)-dependent oxidoreductase [Actinophytocola oryzae]